MIGVLWGGFLVSCQSQKGGGESLADNGGYSDGNFYGDSEASAPSGYPRDGETFATHGGVPFGHNDPVRMEDPGVVEPVVAPAPVRTGERVAATREEADPYTEAYGEGGSYGNDGAVERAVVMPYVERVEPVPVVTKPKVVATKKPSGVSTNGNSKKTVATGAKSKKQGVAVAASGKKSGTTVKAVYKPSSKSKPAAKKKAPVARVHTVKRGDTLSKLAGRYGVTVGQLKKRNQLTTDTIVVGKRLTID